jgi:hypothetical protein
VQESSFPDRLCSSGSFPLITMNHRPLLLLSIAAALLLSLTPGADAQRGARGERIRNLPEPQENLYSAGLGSGARSSGERPAILLTGYWPPTNEMLRRFSPDPIQNPGGWLGSDWEGRGYDLHAYFPEFPHGVGQGVGDFEVDYQDTSNDFWPIADALQPIAIITFSRGFINRTWELEMNNRNLQHWIDDYTPPLQPTPAPPDGSLPANTVRLSALPVQKVVDAVRVANIPGLNVFIDVNANGGGFLSEFIAYHGVWYQALHADPLDPAWCVAGGHVHVGATVGVNDARLATHQTVRAVIRYVDEVTGVSGGETQWHCVPNDHSAGYGSVLTPLGSNSITTNDLELLVVDTIPDQFGLAFYGAATRPEIPMGEGSLCIRAPLYRLPPTVLADADGNASYPLDFSSPPLSGGMSQVTAGSTWHFQYWLRDPGGGASGFNVSSGLSVTFGP